MGETGDTMVLGMLQGGGGIISSSSVEREIRRGGGGERTLLEFLRERMDGAIRVERRRRTLKERLGLNGFSCCGPHWCLGPFVLDDDDQQGPQQQQQVPLLTLAPTDTTSAGDLCSVESPAMAEGMNLAAALAVERQLRATEESDDGVSPSLLGPDITSGPDYGPAQNRMSLMRLLHETECEDLEREEEGSEMKVVGCDVACCVCMGRKKGAAFIPCGHTFCRVCSRELWLNRGSCPLCNRPILEILDIF